VIDHTSGENEPIGYDFGQFVASIGKHCQRGSVSYGNGEGEKDGIAVVLPSLMAGIITDSSTKEFTVPKIE
jgi:hypothetical protein